MCSIAFHDVIKVQGYSCEQEQVSE